jgi:thiamine-phosphate pyrophosphorylase
VLLYAITDRRTLGRDLLSYIAEAIRSGLDLIQIREKDLTGRELFDLASEAAQRAGRLDARILVNGRADVALAARCGGVHLPAGSLPAGELKQLTERNLLVAVSCHSVEEVRRAEAEGADLAVFGPVFDTPSKQGYGPPQGLHRLAAACRAVQMPVLALGGVHLTNARDCLEAGAAGIAAISLFQQAVSLPETVANLRAIERPSGSG